MEEKRTVMQKIRNWLYNRFLPWVTRQEYLAELERLKEANKALKQENRELRAYIEGVQDTVKRQIKLDIHNEVSK